MNAQIWYKKTFKDFLLNLSHSITNYVTLAFVKNIRVVKKVKFFY